MNAPCWRCATVALALLALVADGSGQSTASAAPAAALATANAGAPRTLQLGHGVRLELVWIPAGDFQMGSPFEEDGRFIAEGRRHRVTLTRGWWMGKYPVTQEQWERVMGANPSHVKAPHLPVDQVNWGDSQTFVRALGRILGPDHLTVALPTEAQWEYACRAGRQTRFWSGESEADLAAAAWYARNSGDQPHEVGLKSANPWGLCDVHGNVWQWCQDWLGPYAPAAVTDPSGPDTGTERVLRGGSWSSEADVCRAAYRFSYPPSYRLMTVGLRVVATESP